MMLSLALLPLCLAATPGAPAGPADRYVFPPADLMNVGTYYYPEAWPQEEWPRDMANIHKLGLEFVHMGEFAWTFMEPEEGKFDFAWLDRAVQLAADQGLKVVLCTPSATPPVWLSQRHPEILMVDAAGRTMVHGTRQQATWSSDVYRTYVGRIVDELGRHYGHDPRVWGWQLDNELSHYGREPDHGAPAQAKFRAWLRRKYVTIDALNRDWGTSFWSQRYQDFDQIRIPNADESVAQLNPHAQLDAKRWFADEAADYLRFQTALLRKHCAHRQWITSNFMDGANQTNPSLNGPDFDVLSWTMYPAHGNLNRGPLGFRLGDPYDIAFEAEYMRGLNGQAGVMELQPGQVNWGEVNPQPYPGAIHLWLMRIFASGARFACTYRYRQPLAGTEQYHNGIVGTDGVTPSSGGRQYSQTVAEMVKLRSVAQPGARRPEEYDRRRSAIVYDFDSRYAIDDHKQTTEWNTYGHLLKYYAALKRAGAPVDIVGADGDLSPYAFVVVPACQLVDAAMVARWRAYAEHGGHLILSTRTGEMDRRGQLWEGPWAAPILDLIGADIAFYDDLPPPHVAQVTADGRPHVWSSWGEILQPRREAGATVLATYADQFYAGGAAAVTRRLGEGAVTYIGVDTQDGELEARLVRDEMARAGAKPADYPEGFLVDWRDGLWIATNFTDRPQAAPLGPQADLLLGERQVPIAGVTVWR